MYELRFLMLKGWDNKEKSIKKYIKNLTKKAIEYSIKQKMKYSKISASAFNKRK